MLHEKRSLNNFYSKLQYKIGQDFLDWQNIASVFILSGSESLVQMFENKMDDTYIRD